MSFHDHEGEEYNKRFGVHKRQQDEKLQKAISTQVDNVQSQRDKEIERDISMLELLKEFHLKENNIRWIRHIIGLPDGRGIPMLINYINGRVGSCVLHYDNKRHSKTTAHSNSVESDTAAPHSQ